MNSNEEFARKMKCKSERKKILENEKKKRKHDHYLLPHINSHTMNHEERKRKRKRMDGVSFERRKNDKHLDSCNVLVSISKNRK